jgi:hypothetical protein
MQEKMGPGLNYALRQVLSKEELSAKGYQDAPG